jgi:hypothetical protein
LVNWHLLNQRGLSDAVRSENCAPFAFRRLPTLKFFAYSPQLPKRAHRNPLHLILWHFSLGLQSIESCVAAFVRGLDVSFKPQYNPRLNFEALLRGPHFRPSRSFDVMVFLVETKKIQ